MIMIRHDVLGTVLSTFRIFKPHNIAEQMRYLKLTETVYLTKEYNFIYLFIYLFKVS